MRRLALLAVGFALLVAGCYHSEGTVAPLPQTVEGTVAQPTETAPTEVPEGNPDAGERVFASAGCGACHVLEAAGTTGTVGPNLDESRPDRALIFDRVTNGKGAMPAFGDRLSDKQIADVAAFVFQATQGG